ncbi:hypothetical protein [Engelhardtia mirabilis]|uniref:ATP-dependent zinc metalloprotease FtsH n=1 Tax=Engelhardtia mirabilis TaxID=2528011 RepID=A0A518BEE8_9BACT|nr:hypothetical protein Pla133_04150 [Planctomycetes bacterium Pla133]QDU99676.1 hypothetical protein Pla86_04150 [Planctomycetes bacterium Pla86]
MNDTGHPEAEAWHEAGHAVVAHLLGGRVRELTLEAEEEHLEGRASIEWRGLDASALAVVSGQVALGGPLAELLFRGDDSLDDPELLSTWEQDWSEVERCARVVEANAALRARLIRTWIDRVQGLLADDRVEERIARVADALDAHGTLDEELFESSLVD